MKKIDHELKIAVIEAQNLTQKLSFAKHCISALTVVASIGLIVFGFTQVLQRQSPEGINAVANVVKQFGLDTTVASVVALLTTAGWAVERRGKVRALHKLKVTEERGNDASPKLINRSPNGEDT